MRSLPSLERDRLQAIGSAVTYARLAEIERALKFDPDPEYRRQLVREYLDLTDKERNAT